MARDFDISPTMEEFIRTLEIPSTAGCRFMSILFDTGRSKCYVSQRRISSCERDARTAIRGCIGAMLVKEIESAIPGVRPTAYTATDVAWSIELSDPIYSQGHYQCGTMEYPKKSRVWLVHPYNGDDKLQRFLSNGTGMLFDSLAVYNLLQQSCRKEVSFKVGCWALSTLRIFGQYDPAQEYIPAKIKQSWKDHRIWHKNPGAQNIKREVRDRMFRSIDPKALIIYPDLRSAEVNILRVLLGKKPLEDAYADVFSEHVRPERKILMQMVIHGFNLNGINRNCGELSIEPVSEEEYCHSMEQLNSPRFIVLKRNFRRENIWMQREIKRTVARITIPAHYSAGFYTIPQFKTGIQMHDGFFIPLREDRIKDGYSPRLAEIFRYHSKRVLGKELPVSMRVLEANGNQW